MNRKYVVIGPFGQQDEKTGDVVAPGGTILLDEHSSRVKTLLAAGAVELETEHDAEAERMTCPLCEEQGVKKPAELADAADLERHYNDRHPGFAVPEWQGGNA